MKKIPLAPQLNFLIDLEIPKHYKLLILLYYRYFRTDAPCAVLINDLRKPKFHVWSVAVSYKTRAQTESSTSFLLQGCGTLSKLPRTIVNIAGKISGEGFIFSSELRVLRFAIASESWLGVDCRQCAYVRSKIGSMQISNSKSLGRRCRFSQLKIKISEPYFEWWFDKLIFFFESVVSDGRVVYSILNQTTWLNMMRARAYTT